jgi:transcriptional regulator with XRE-family HTH domain
MSNRIKELREVMGLTQAQLAEKINVTDKAVSKWESTGGEPDATPRDALRKVFGGISSDYLNGEEAISPADKAMESKIADWKAMQVANKEFQAFYAKCLAYLKKENLGEAFYNLLPSFRNGETFYTGFNEEGTGFSYEGLMDYAPELIPDYFPEKVDFDFAEGQGILDCLPLAYENAKKKHQAAAQSYLEHAHLLGLENVPGEARPDPENDLVKEVSSRLEELSCKQFKFYLYVRFYIDHGAFYHKNSVGQSVCDGGRLEVEIDQSKTALAYNAALDWIERHFKE